MADLPGVADVEVSEGESDQDGPEATTFFVTLDADPSAEGVAAVLTELRPTTGLAPRPGSRPCGTSDRPTTRS